MKIKECDLCKNGCSGINESPCSCKCHIRQEVIEEIRHEVLDMMSFYETGMEFGSKLLEKLNNK